MDEPAVASADGLREPGEVAWGPVCFVARCVPPVGDGVRWASAVRCEALVSRLATFGALIGCRARACTSRTCAYVPERDGYRPGSRLRVAHSDTTRRASWRPTLRPRALVSGVGGAPMWCVKRRWVVVLMVVGCRGCGCGSWRAGSGCGGGPGRGRPGPRRFALVSFALVVGPGDGVGAQ